MTKQDSSGRVRDDFVIRIGGDTAIGGVISTGENFATAAARIGFRTFTFRTYPAEIKGGHAWFPVRISNKPVYSLGDGCDILIVFDQEAYELHKEDLNRRRRADLRLEPSGRNTMANRVRVPFQQMAREELDFVRGTNVLILGVMAGLFGLNLGTLEEGVRTATSGARSCWTRTCRRYDTDTSTRRRFRSRTSSGWARRTTSRAW